MNNKKIIIGTRGSNLSLTQTNIVKNLLEQLFKNKVIVLKTIKTLGDKNMNPIPLDTAGKGWFTKEIDKQLLDKKIDLAVHSLKDILDDLPRGLKITAIAERIDPSEVLISRKNLRLNKLKKGAVVGTDSLRRKIQILDKRPDLTVRSIRGNVNTRLEKLEKGEYDAIVLAFAGLKRLGLENRITQHFDPKDFIPSPGQGALAVVTRKNDIKLNKVVSKLNKSKNNLEITAERTISKIFGGGCSMPVGAYAKINSKKITIFAMLGTENEKHFVKGEITGNVKYLKKLAKQLGNKLLKNLEILKQKRKQKFIVLTREKTQNMEFAKKLKLVDYKSFLCPTIEFSKNLSVKKFKKYISRFDYDWIIFTSSNGVKFFMQGIKDSGQKKEILKNTKIAVVGDKTKLTAENFKLNVSFFPKEYTSENLAKTIPNIKNKKILIPRSNIADKKIVNILKKRGSIVSEIPVYKTKRKKLENLKLKSLLKTNKILFLTFTSPSTIEGFVKNLKKEFLERAVKIPVISIGPVTTDSAIKLGFKKIYEANIHTIDGMIKKIKEIDL